VKIALESMHLRLSLSSFTIPTGAQEGKWEALSVDYFLKKASNAPLSPLASKSRRLPLSDVQIMRRQLPVAAAWGLGGGSVQLGTLSIDAGCKKPLELYEDAEGKVSTSQTKHKFFELSGEIPREMNIYTNTTTAVTPSQYKKWKDFVRMEIDDGWETLGTDFSDTIIAGISGISKFMQLKGTPDGNFDDYDEVPPYAEGIAKEGRAVLSLVEYKERVELFKKEMEQDDGGYKPCCAAFSCAGVEAWLEKFKDLEQTPYFWFQRKFENENTAGYISGFFIERALHQVDEDSKEDAGARIRRRLIKGSS